MSDPQVEATSAEGPWDEDEPFVDLDSFSEDEPGIPEGLPVPDDYFEDLEEDQLPGAVEWEDGLSDAQPDTCLASSPERGCILAWYCRTHPEPNSFPGCETECIWTRKTGAALSHCFGHYRGKDALAPGDFLEQTVQQLCEQCVQKRSCQVETEAHHP